MSVELTLLTRVRHRGVDITGSRLPGLLALLAADLRTGCGSARLVDALWPDRRPEHPAKALRTLVSRARQQLGADAIVSTPTGYRLALAEDQVDAAAVLVRAAAAEQAARAGDHADALAHAAAGLALFEGRPDDAPAGDPLSALRAARATTFRTLTRVRALALSRLGRAAEAVGPLTMLADADPWDEELLLELLRSEATHQALSRYKVYSDSLREQTGMDPGPALRRMHRELLLSDAPPVRLGIRHEPNQLLGRDDDITAILELLHASRVTSIVGVGGLGKTRLAYAVSRRAPHRAVYLVELAGVPAGGDVAGEVAAAIGVGEAALVDALDQGPALLVLDNCEHLVRGAADLVQTLVARTAELRVLTTSRAPLGLSSESVYPLPELDLPTMVELFGQRARAVRPDLAVPAGAVRDLCRSLDGLPLAVELAAARCRVMSVAEIARRLDDRFALLRGGSRDAPRRHRTLHAVIEWSWQLLDPPARRAMRALSVFPGGFTAAAAERLTGDAAVVEQLVEQSLLKVADGDEGTRFRMLETVREFAVARRAEAGETEQVVDGFLGWVRSWRGFDLRDVRMVRAEQDNLVQALRYALDREDGASVAVAGALLGVLWLTESNLGRLTALAADLPEILSRFRPEENLIDAVRAAAVCCALTAFVTRGPRPLRALVTLRRLPPPDPDTLVGAAQIALAAPDVATMRALGGSERPLVAGAANYALSFASELANDPVGALRAAREMLARLGDAGGPWMRALAHARIGELALQAEPGQEASRHIEAALSIMEELGAWPSATRARWALVLADLQRGALDEAERGLDQLAGGGTIEEAGRLMFDTCARAEILLGRGDVDGGLRLWRQAADRLPDTGDPWALEVRAVAVIAHAQYGLVGKVRDIAGTLPVTTIAAAPAADFPLGGALLLAAAVVELDRGATAPAVRMIALAERLGYRRVFQPTMSQTRIREIAVRADRPAYDEAVSSLAGLDHDGLRAEARRLIGSDPGGTGPAPTHSRPA